MKIVQAFGSSRVQAASLYYVCIVRIHTARGVASILAPVVDTVGAFAEVGAVSASELIVGATGEATGGVTLSGNRRHVVGDEGRAAALIRTPRDV